MEILGDPNCQTIMKKNKVGDLTVPDIKIH